MDLDTITIDDFKDQFPRGFSYDSPDADDYVSDSDIERAFAEAKMTFNQSLVSNGTDENITLVFLYLTAHYLSHDLRAILQGFNGGGGALVNSRSVGSVSESYTIPDVYIKDPVLTFYTTTSYGLKYLNMIYPMLRGNIDIAYGDTLP